MNNPDISVGYPMTVCSLFVAKPAVDIMTTLNSLFQVMTKGYVEAGDLLRAHCLSLWP